MKLRILAVAIATAAVLTGCGGAGDPETPGTPQATPTAAEPATEPTSGGQRGGSQASGDADCSVFSKDEVITWALYTQFLGQVRDVSGLGVLSQVGYTPEVYGAMLDELDQLKGIEGEL